MQKWNGSLLRKFDDVIDGNASVGTTVVVRNTVGNTLAVIYDVDDTNSVQKNNPFVTDDFGRYSFFAPNGKYTIEFGDGSDSIDIILTDNIDFTGVYRKNATVADIGLGTFKDGEILSVSDRDNERFIVSASGTVNGLDVLDAGSGKVATYQPNFMGVNPKALGAQYDEVTDDTAAHNRSVLLGLSLGFPVLLHSGVSINTKITYFTNSVIHGRGVDVTELKTKDGSNSDLLYADNADALWGTNSELGANNATITGLTLNGNRDRAGNPSGNTSGVPLKLYGRTNIFEHISIKFAAGVGLRTEWGEGGTLTEGLEGRFRSISIGYSGEHGWRFAGAHDSHCDDIVIHTSGQKATNTYKGLWIEKGNARWSKVHSYSLFYTDGGFPAEAARQTHALYIEGGGGANGNEFTQSHFEGGNINIYNGANGTLIDSTCRTYYPWTGGVNIVNDGSTCIIKCWMGEEFKGIGLPLAKGIIFGGTYGGVSNCTIELNGGGMEAGWVDFGGSNGSNSIVVRGFNVTVGNVAYSGTPNITDDVDIYVSGPELVSFKVEAFQTRNAVGKLTALGSTQGDAQVVDLSLRTVAAIGAAGAGLRLVNSAVAKNGHKVQITEISGTSKKIYPNSGGNFLGYGVNGAVTLLGNKTAEFTVIDDDAGEWIVSLGG